MKVTVIDSSSVSNILGSGVRSAQSASGSPEGIQEITPLTVLHHDRASH